MNAIVRYYFTISAYNIVFSIICGICIGILRNSFPSFLVWAIIIFFSIGSLAGILIFNTLTPNEYYCYHNLGYSRKMLYKKIAVIQTAFSAPFILIFSAISIFF